MKKYIALYGKAGSGKDFLASKIIEYFEKYSTKKCHRFAFADDLKMMAKHILNLSDKDADQFMHDEDAKNNTYIDLKTYKLWRFGKYDVPKPSSCVKLPVTYKGSIVGLSEESKICFLNAEDLGNITEECFPNNISISEYLKDYTDFNFISYREFIVYLGSYVFQRMIHREFFINQVFNSKEYEKAVFNDDIIIITDVRFYPEFKKCRDSGYFIVNVINDDQVSHVSNIAEDQYNKFKSDYVFYNSYDQSTFDERFGKLIKTIIDKNHYTEVIENVETN